MKIFLKQFLLLGGFYFIVSFFLGFYETRATNILDDIISFSFIVMIVILCFKKSYGFLTIFQDKYSKISLYAMSLGGINYIGILIFIVYGAIDGYSSAMAKYKGEGYEGIIAKYLEYTIMFYAILSILILLWATYANFIKPYIKKS